MPLRALLCPLRVAAQRATLPRPRGKRPAIPTGHPSSSLDFQPIPQPPSPLALPRCGSQNSQQQNGSRTPARSQQQRRLPVGGTQPAASSSNARGRALL